MLKTKLIVGLGNVGDRYLKTRHNAGFMALDQFADKHSLKFKSKLRSKSSMAEYKVGDTRVILAKPTTLMNLSGNAVGSLMSNYLLMPEDCLIIYDDFALNFGTVRVRRGGSSAGHNGVDSLPKAVKEESFRIRIGIANELIHKIDKSDFVLTNFTSSELAALKSETLNTVETYIENFLADNLQPDTK